MKSRHQSSKSKRPTIAFHEVPLEVKSFDHADVGPRKDTSLQAEPQTRSRKQPETRSANNLCSTADFIRAVGGIWKAISEPSDVSQHRASCQHDNVLQKENVVCLSGAEFLDLKSAGFNLPTAKSNFEHLKDIKKAALFGSCKKFANNNVFWRHNMVSYYPFHIGWCMNESKSTGVSYASASTDGSMSGKFILGSKDLLNVSTNETIRTGGSCISDEKTPQANISSAKGVDRDSSVDKASDLVYKEHCPCALYSAYSIQQDMSMVEPIFVSGPPCSGLHRDRDIDFLASTDCIFGECQPPHEFSSERLSASKDFIPNIIGSNELVLGAEYPPKHSLSIQGSLDTAFAKKKHALAGALAGTIVSLCLHPADTIKTIIQARYMNQNTICHTFESVVSERGVMGLYRGIASNITSSAPISAVYTFTYESVKGALLPFLPKEYYAFAHCTAGGCASIATSFIFTPSERIKQQMQVGSQYQNCWNALIGVIRKGGLSSLYAGWGAVLCRNIPHSVIKFYTYESLKQLLLPSTQPDACLTTLQTLACGGLAGSTAALFTTPLDVVKTRLQTQAPGSLKQYNGVFHALTEIAKHEGLRGLYRGLTPRLAMYITQGAIFFASYEFFKMLFTLEPQLLTQDELSDMTLHHEIQRHGEVTFIEEMRQS